ncbi:uncharacterized protein LOC141874411 [Acropora palmata]|uniref:uncharacterized protein LOC141874411 n=1 Tax=Acropora palmata TaxID=6131 RepID=UPI003DA1C29C
MVPNVIRTLLPERTVKQYQSYCKESGFEGLGRSTLLRILKTCAASMRKSLQGLDYISCLGAEAFDDLLEVIEVLGDAGEGMGWVKRQQHQLRESKGYLKSDYKVHVCTTSKVADHCRKYAKEHAFQSPCDHEHTEVCDRCELLKTSIQAIEAGLVAQNDNQTPEVKEELSFAVKQAKSAILAWKSHLLRSVNQDAARLEVLDSIIGFTCTRLGHEVLAKKISREPI